MPLRTTTTTVPGTQGTGLDSGMLLYPGEQLIARCVGLVDWAPGTNNGGGATAPSGGANPANFPVVLSAANPYSLTIVALPDGVAPNALPSLGGSQYTTGILALPYTAAGNTVLVTFPTTAGLTLPALGGAAAWRLWLLINDDIPGNNTGSFVVDLTLNERPNPPTVTAAGLLISNAPAIRIALL